MVHRRASALRFPCIVRAGGAGDGRPGNEKAAAAGGLRASSTDREQVIELLKVAFAQGRLAKDDFDVRVGQVLASRTYAELDAVTAGIPAGVAEVKPPRTRALKPAHRTAKVAAWSTGVIAPLTVLLGAIAILTGNVALLALSGFAFTVAAAVGWGAVVTLAHAASAASSQQQDAIERHRRALAGQELVHGHDHPDTIAARATLAAALRVGGKLKSAIGQYERVLARYWATDYDWRACEARLNALPQFKTEIDGEDVYFIHVKSPHAGALPLIVTHGWPGSVLEMLGVIGPLTDPTAHGGSAEDAFDLVVPSIPGYGFSAEPAEAGWNVGRVAGAWAELMRRSPRAA